MQAAEHGRSYGVKGVQEEPFLRVLAAPHRHAAALPPTPGLQRVNILDIRSETSSLRPCLSPFTKDIRVLVSWRSILQSFGGSCPSQTKVCCMFLDNPFRPPPAIPILLLELDRPRPTPIEQLVRLGRTACAVVPGAALRLQEQVTSPDLLHEVQPSSLHREAAA